MFEHDFIKIALFVGIVSSVLCSYIGNFILIRKMTFISIALSEIAAVGVALGMMFNFSVNLCAFFSVFMGILFFWYKNTQFVKTSESFIGLVYALSAALGFILVSKNPMVESIGIDLVSGNLLYCTYADMWMIGKVAIVILILHVFFFKEFLFISFDRETAVAQSLPVSFYDFVLMLTIGMCIAFCMKLTGVLFVFSSMIIPPLVALLCFNRIWLVFAAGGVFSCIGVFSGIKISYSYDIPTSPAIIVFYGLIYLVVWVFKKFVISER